MSKTVNSNQSNGNGNDHSDYQPSKTYEHLHADVWLEEDEEEPGQTKIVSSKGVEDELGIDKLGEDQ